MKRLLLGLCRVLGLFALARWLTRDRLRILCYHGLWLGPAPHHGNFLFMSPERFEARMRRLQAAGYQAVSLQEGWARCRDGRLTGREFVITIDDGWSGTALHMAPLLQALRWPSTLYIATRDLLRGAPVAPVMVEWLLARARRAPDAQQLLAGTAAPATHAEWSDAIEDRVKALPDAAAQETEWTRLGGLLGVDVPAVLAARSLHLMSPEQLRECQRSGMDVQLHTHRHSLHGFAPEQVADEIGRNRRELAALLGRDEASFDQFCYPSGLHEPRAFEPLTRLGVQTATTTVPGLARREANPLALPRLLDGEDLSQLEFDAQFSGLLDLLRRR